MNIHSQLTHKLLSGIPVLIIAFLCFWFSYETVWSGDAVYYQFFVTPDYNGFSSDRIEFSQLWQSQVNHYHTINGRFFCHVLVQIFCGLLPKFWFAIANSLVWIAFMLILARMAGNSITNRFALMTIIAVLFWLSGWYLSFDPPIQINYVWMGAMSFLWIYLFMERNDFKSWWSIAFWAIFSFFTGEGNESFVIPIGGAIILWFIKCKGNFNRVQWIGAIAFGIGGLVLCLAPGNFIRLGGATDNAQTGLLQFVAYTLESVIPAMIIPILFLVLITVNRQFRNRIYRSDTTITFLIITIGVSLILNGFFLYRKFVISDRMLYIDIIAIIIIFLKNLRDVKIKILTIVSLLSILSISATAIFNQRQLTLNNTKYNMIQNLYHKSDSGLIVLPDEIYAHQCIYFGSTGQPWVQYERCSNSSKPWLKIYPEALTKIDFKADTNLCVQFVDQGWIMVQSKSNPADFYIDKILLPGILEKELSSRRVDFSSESVSLVDSTANSKIAIYINRRPFIKSSISTHFPKDINDMGAEP